MATVPQPHHLDQDLDTVHAPLSGHTVDALLADDKVNEARAEFERLCLEGLDSGEPVLMTPEKWKEFRLDLHRKELLAS